MPFSGDQSRALLDTARAAIRGALSGESPAPPAVEAPADPLGAPAGCFVSLHEIETRRLRGCVGRIEAREALIVTVHQVALSVLSDPRFANDPVTLDLLAALDLELTVLSPLRPAEHCLDFDPMSHGIYLTTAGRSGCFLPQVARETGWSREQLLSRLCCEKLDLPADAWQHPTATLHTFTVEIIGPEPFEAPAEC